MRYWSCNGGNHFNLVFPNQSMTCANLKTSVLIPESSEWCRLLCTQDEVQRLKAKAAQVRPNFCTSFENLKNAENDQWIPPGIPNEELLAV